MKIGYFPFYLATLLRMLKAASLSYGYVYTADSLSLLTKTDKTRAGRAQSMLRLSLLSSLDITEEERLNTKGPTNKHAKSSKHDLFLYFSMFCSKKSTNWITSEGIQCTEAIIYPNILK